MANEKQQFARRLIEAHLGSRLNDREWQRLNENGHITAKGLISEAHLDTLVALIRDQRATWGTAAGTADVTDEMAHDGEVPIPEEDARLDALAQILVHEARKDSALQEFRRTYLPTEGITRDHLLEWMLDKSASEVWGTGNYFLDRSITIPNDTVMQANSARRQGRPETVFDVPVNETLHVTAADLERVRTYKIPFYLPTERFVYEVQMQGSGSFLDKLWQLSVRLAADYGWSMPEAVTFVVTDDYRPRIIPARYRIEADRISIPALARIVLTLDPAVAPQSVAEVYRQARQKALPGVRIRDLSEKHRLLALFATEQSSEMSLDERMAQWNYAHPNMLYQKRSYFDRDCRLALARLRQEYEK